MNESWEEARARCEAALGELVEGRAEAFKQQWSRSGDTVIVHGNLFKTITKVSSMVGITTLFTFLSRGGR